MLAKRGRNHSVLCRYGKKIIYNELVLKKIRIKGSVLCKLTETFTPI